MAEEFHGKEFDEATLLKLEIFRYYIREWVPVFKSQKSGGAGSLFRQINLYDYFAGPGTDALGSFGSPLIIQEEVKAFCTAKADVKADVPVRMLFNDKNAQFISTLKQNIDQFKCDENCCQFSFSSEPFQDLLPTHLDEMKRSGHANLVLLDQFGVNQVTPEVVRSLLDCKFTDILFFISSSYINRFIETSEIQGLFSIDPDQLKDVEYNAIHRYICDYFRMQLQGTDALVAPFSIKKGSNIYGVIFASKDLLGMEKFLKVCWGLDSVSGSANYNIDNDMSYSGDTLFEEFNIPTRLSLFERDLLEFIRQEKPNNQQVYRFALEKGFHSVKANDMLRVLQEKGEILVFDAQTGKPARKRSFYLSGKAGKEIRVIFETM